MTKPIFKCRTSRENLRWNEIDIRSLTSLYLLIRQVKHGLLAHIQMEFQR